jgi:hypothetical protein
MIHIINEKMHPSATNQIIFNTPLSIYTLDIMLRDRPAQPQNACASA